MTESETPRTCPNCGYALAPWDRYCPNCGRPVIPTQPASAPHGRSTPGSAPYERRGSCWSNSALGCTVAMATLVLISLAGVGCSVMMGLGW